MRPRDSFVADVEGSTVRSGSGSTDNRATAADPANRTVGPAVTAGTYPSGSRRMRRAPIDAAGASAGAGAGADSSVGADAEVPVVDDEGRLGADVDRLGAFAGRFGADAGRFAAMLTATSSTAVGDDPSADRAARAPTATAGRTGSPTARVEAKAAISPGAR